MRSNCLAWAITQRLRFGGKLKIRKSPDYPWLPRATWSPADEPGRFYRFVARKPPKNPTLRQRWLPFHTIWFEGAVRFDHYEKEKR